MQATLLATAFSEASNLRTYTKFLQRRISKYLSECHVSLKQDCICLVAVTEPNEESPGAVDRLTDEIRWIRSMILTGTPT